MFPFFTDSEISSSCVSNTPITLEEKSPYWSPPPAKKVLHIAENELRQVESPIPSNPPVSWMRRLQASRRAMIFARSPRLAEPNLSASGLIVLCVCLMRCMIPVSSVEPQRGRLAKLSLQLRAVGVRSKGKICAPDGTIYLKYAADSAPLAAALFFYFMCAPKFS